MVTFSESSGISSVTMGEMDENVMFAAQIE
jgi:hypothetical protein